MSDSFYQLATQRYACKSSQPLSDDIVLLHGWGTNSNSWSPLISELEKTANVVAFDLPGFGDSDSIPDFNLDAVLSLIAAHLPEKCILIGWSLGGILATQLAARYPNKITKIITLAANAKFVASENYKAAMSPSTNRQFNQGFSTDPAGTLKLFCGLLSQGDSNERALLKKVRSLIQPDVANKNWSQALELLSQIDNREVFAKLSQEGLHLLGEKDALVPVTAYDFMSISNPKQKLKIIPAAAHAIHWSNPELIASLITDFLISTSSSLDKKQVANSFSRAAHTYDSVASLQRYAGGLLLQRVKKSSEAKVVVDLGCGTGYFTPQLQDLFSDSLVIGVDIAEGMLKFASENHPSQKNWLCGDADYLPFAASSVDIIFSNFALQWCTDLPHLFAELNRILKADGQCIFTSLGPATLHEMKAAWKQVDMHVHVNKFHEPDLLLKNLQNANFQIIGFDNKVEVMQFENLSDLTRSLKCLGAQNANRGRATGLTGRKKIQAFKEAYENFRNNNLLPATYDIFYLQVKK